MKYELLIGLRYTRSKRRAGSGNRFISFISMVSMFGIALGVAALIVVLSVMNGFQEELRTRILGVASHIQLTGIDDQLANWQQLADGVMKHPQVRAAAPFVNEQGMLAFDSQVRGAVIRGILPEAEDKVADFARHMKSGRLDALRPGEFGIVLGAELARALRVMTGEKLTLIAPQGLVTPAAIVPRLKQFTVVGIFEAGMFEFDSGLALIHLADAQVLYRLGENVSGVRLKVDDLFAAPRISRELGPYVPTEVYVSDWTKSHANFFRAVAIEKNMMFIILSLIVAVAAFNIVSTLVMAVRDKRADIAILRTLGASPRSVMTIFIIQGLIIGLVGLALGVIGGFVLASNLDVVIPAIEKLSGTTLWSKEVYYISELPSKVLPSDVVSIVSIAFVLTLISTLYPSWRASRINPAEALRYE
ncbi:MAG: lipoprotein-releasing ABC transporter permease subunit [Sterolibacteriaceae bacterium]|uniref:Lipoprotein-releasing ABC transporter permease subunit n=1 Tax=Candidatus Methylophosphatis roskildensis TaxID=2899263 RepID=A0A9D7E443_9PROT|nr:lipoprotein-releasing ABC transporter permease subunit [Candidatus Methylophosphatis roskildensis]MBK7236570.1 lipoprotein-releasing ABC transporter permease subunit [Sterolibacteriaceae bacterium]